jgi:hypothetical protein
VEEIIDTIKLISKYIPKEGWTTLCLNYYNERQFQYLSISPDCEIRWGDLHPMDKDSHSHDWIPADINNKFFKRKMKHLMEFNDSFVEKLNDKLFELEEESLRRI